MRYLDYQVIELIIASPINLTNSLLAPILVNELLNSDARIREPRVAKTGFLGFSIESRCQCFGFGIETFSHLITRQLSAKINFFLKKWVRILKNKFLRRPILDRHRWPKWTNEFFPKTTIFWDKKTVFHFLYFFFEFLNEVYGRCRDNGNSTPISTRYQSKIIFIIFLKYCSIF